MPYASIDAEAGDTHFEKKKNTTSNTYVMLLVILFLIGSHMRRLRNYLS
jgi:hypothetical protein